MMSIKKSDVTFIAEAVKETCLSLYLPTHVAGQEIRQDPIRLKNLLDRARDQLLSLGQGTEAIDALLSPAIELLDDSQYQFWEHQGRGLALFLGESFYHIYRLDDSVPELAIIGDRFHITPLLPVLHRVDQFLLLSLSQNEALLYGASPNHIKPISLEELPNSLEEALKYDDPEAQLQYHSGGGADTQGGQTPTFHGQGVGTADENEKDRIRRYCQQLDNAICEATHDKALPLVLAGVEFVQDIFREVSNYPNLVASGLKGNPEAEQVSDLHQEALALFEPMSQNETRQAWEGYERLSDTDKITNQIKDILVAANRGQVETLFLDPERSQWGTYDAASAHVELHEQAHPKSDDLLNIAAISVLANSGAVYTKPMSPASPIAATLRYPLYTDQETSETIRS
ncbi:MAG: hypothetical protein ACFB4J_08955 [Elainellaceae cyanobacterium]